MASFVRDGLRRRQVVGSAMAAPLAVAALPAPDAQGLADLSGYLLAVLEAVAVRDASLEALARKVLGEMAPDQVTGIVRSAHARVHDAVGACIASAAATTPALVDDDRRAGRCVLIHGVAFAHVEIALLYPLSRSAEALPRLP